MARQRPGLRPPVPGDGAKVPTTGRRRPLWRACSATHPQPWWFSSRDQATDPGRFDLVRPGGTCYWALSAAGAVLEATADPDQLDPPVMTIHALAQLKVWRAGSVRMARSGLADTTRPSVPRLTGELGTIVPYDLPWQWADEFAHHERSGIVYRARFSLDESVALFGPSGIPPDPPAADRGPATAIVAQLPPAFRAGIGTVGALDALPRATAP